jgi:hypothetical protein
LTEGKEKPVAKRCKLLDAEMNQLKIKGSLEVQRVDVSAKEIRVQPVVKAQSTNYSK